MIVTKAMERIYLIRKSCWMITTSPDGDLGLAYTSVHWKEGMEVFESEEECLAVLQKRRTEKMDSGACPRCNLKSLTSTERDITKFPVVNKSKAGVFYQCPACKTLWFKVPHLTSAMAFDVSLYDFVLEWAGRDLKPSAEMKQTLAAIKDHSEYKHSHLYPAKVTMKSGEIFENALIRLEKVPPEADWFNKKNWFYLDQVKSVEPSPNVYPFGIAKHMFTHGGFMYIKDTASGQVYGFDVHAGIFMPPEFVGKNFQLSSAGSGDVKFVFEPPDRGGSGTWHFTQPKKAVVVWGDLQ